MHTVHLSAWSPYDKVIWHCHRALPCGIALCPCHGVAMWPCLLTCGFAMWPCHVALPCGLAMWPCHMALPQWPCPVALPSGLAKWPCHVTLLCGLALWQNHINVLLKSLHSVKISFRHMLFDF